MTITLNDITIHPIIEQEGAFFDAMGFSRNADQGVARREPLLAAAGILRSGRQALALYREFRRQRRRTTIFWSTPASAMTSRGRRGRSGHDEQRPLREGAGGGRRLGERHRRSTAHAPAHRSRRLEHKTRKRPLGADISQGEIHHGGPRARTLDGAAEGRSRQRAVDHRLGAADHRRQARADRQKRFRLQ